MRAVPLNVINDSGAASADHQPVAVHEDPAAYGLVLPVEPGFRSLPPAGSWEDGHRPSLAALELG